MKGTRGARDADGNGDGNDDKDGQRKRSREQREREKREGKAWESGSVRGRESSERGSV